MMTYEMRELIGEMKYLIERLREEGSKEFLKAADSVEVARLWVKERKDRLDEEDDYE